MERSGEVSRVQTYISCWHENEVESEAMWRLYSNFLENAVAIRTTYNGLYLALGRDPRIDIGKVQYQNGYADINNAYWRKRKSFMHEREVRAVLTILNCNEMGVKIDCDLSILIEEVFVSPSAPNWFVELVNDVNEKYGVKVQVSPSELLEEPFF